MFAIQKQPIFTVSRGGVKLWEVVIDGKDIEFVTEPFSNEEEEFFRDCIGTISMAFKLLCDFKDKRNPGTVTLNNWLHGGSLVGAESTIITRTEEKLAERKATLIAIQKGLIRILEEGGFAVEINGKIFDPIKDHPFKNSDIPGGWRPHFQPQVTIQHPLDSSIPLIRTLFDSIMAGPIARGIKTSMPIHEEAAPTKADGLFCFITDLSKAWSEGK
ncbi:MAG: hypothetical protein K2W94_03910 [Alphaproteobacteria bacterium]|nr:hypothetical protein [Alphaproteobacteria bacterium]